MARSLDGSGDYLTDTFTPTLTTDDTLSIVTWFKSDLSVSQGDLITLSEDGANGEAFRLRAALPLAAGNEITVTSRSSNAEESATTANEWTNGTWYHAAGVWNGTSSRTAYLDGDAANKGTDTATKSVGTLGRTTIGAFYGSSVFNLFTGDLAHAAIYDGALSDDDVAALASGMSPLKVRPDILLHYWPLMGHSPEIDLVGGKDLTVTGATEAPDHSPIILPRKRHFGVAPATGNVEKTPTVGSLTLTGESPSVAFKVNLAQTAGSATLTGESPSVLRGRDIAVDAGSLTLTGQSPAVAFELHVPLTAGSVAFTGEAPSVAYAYNAALDAGSLTLAGESPAASFKTNADVDAGSITLTGESPSVAVSGGIDVDAGSLTLTGASATVTLGIGFSPTAGAVTISGESPAVTAKTAILPASGSLTLTGQSPNVALKIDTPVAAGALTLTGEAPAVAKKTDQVVTAGALTLGGESTAVTFKTALSLTAGGLTVTGVSPAVAFALNTFPTGGTISVTGSIVDVDHVPGVVAGGTVVIAQQDRTVAIAP